MIISGCNLYIKIRKTQVLSEFGDKKEGEKERRREMNKYLKINK